ncbi:hypothetical protein G3A45_04055 [Caloranaerobacter azorensis]|uniref:Uncharacterized protein n=1 Tax=Caloranaerobacter azorensis TaxID=116090 RepID=A0A6P1YAZ7_9FIRM|nr:hypothetical protein G3A45_04055 [Caloranaerobacter azorensis]
MMEMYLYIKNDLGFILTMWNVNEDTLAAIYNIRYGFILTMWNVNLNITVLTKYLSAVLY